jgi:hypothetical protein
MGDVIVEADSRAMRRFHDALSELGNVSGKDFKTVLKSEVGAVLNGAITRTKKASVKSINSNHDRQPGAAYAFVYPGPTEPVGKPYSAAYIAKQNARAARARNRKGGKAIYYLSGSSQPHRYPNALWQQITQARVKSLEGAQKARGLAASMWVKIANGLGIEVNAPNYVRNATHWKRGDMSEMVRTHEAGAGKSYELGFANSLTHTNNWAEAGTAFRASLNARANYFGQAVKLAAKGKIKAIMDRYPGLASVS